jgi:uncharacterized Zn-binding protein involved in type VI secretion
VQLKRSRGTTTIVTSGSATVVINSIAIAFNW